VKKKAEASAVLSLADQAAKKMSYRIPGVVFQPFAVQNLTDDDYFDNLHFSNALPYRKWNSDLRRALEDYRKQSKAPPKEMAFLLSGAVRTLKHTHKSIFRNWIWPLCAPPNCIAHVVTHFSSSDNRPAVDSDDPNGKVVIDDNGIEDVDTFFKNVEWPDKNFLQFHKVPPYNIASDEESKAMDRMEQEIGDDTIASRLRIFRYGDPRRYSMWFGRAYMWDFVKKLENERERSFDFYAFGRPDVVWIRPSLKHKAFEDFGKTSSDIWLPDSYIYHPPDTMAFLPSHDVAEKYFSLSTFVKPGILCLGGPQFNTSLVSERLEALQIKTEPSDWCERLDTGISEKILGRRLQKEGIKQQRIPAVAVIVRPPNKPSCNYMDPRHTNGYAEYDISFVGHVSCKVAQYKLENGFVEPYEEPAVFRLRGVHGDSHLCYTRLNNGTITALPCVDPVAHPAQMYTVVETTNRSMDDAILLGFSDELVPQVRVIDKETIDIKKRHWRRIVNQTIIETKGVQLEPLNQYDSFLRFHETSGDRKNRITYHQHWKKDYKPFLST